LRQLVPYMLTELPLLVHPLVRFYVSPSAHDGFFVLWFCRSLVPALYKSQRRAKRPSVYGNVMEPTMFPMSLFIDVFVTAMFYTGPQMARRVASRRKCVHWSTT
jgi:hypothetical protein